MAKPRRPGALLAIAIIGLVLGLLGGCAGLFGVVTPIFQESLQATQRELATPGAPPEMVEMQRNMEDQMNAVTHEWMPFTITHQALNLLLSLALVGASLLLLVLHPKGPLLFFLAVAMNLVVDVLGAVLGALVQREAMAVMRQAIVDPAMTGGAPDPGVAHMMEGIFGASTWVGLCFAGVWVLTKLSYYLASAVYLRKPNTRALFTPATANIDASTHRGDQL